MEAGARKSFGHRVYDAVTALIAGRIAVRDPAKAARYRADRKQYRTYVAGEVSDHNQQWRPRNRSADTEIKRAALWVTARCRDQVQNNPFIAGAIRRITANVVRSGIMPEFQFRSRSGQLDKAGNEKWDELFRRWAKYADISGHDSYGALQKLGLRHMWSDGRYLIHRVYDDSLKGIVPLRLELIECDQLDKTVDGILPSGNEARRGIEFDKSTGRPVTYHVLESHPGDYLSRGLPASIPIPAADIIHVYERERISQSTGISWLASVVMEAYDMETFREFTRVGAKVESSFVAFIHSAFPTGTVPLGGGLPAGGQPAPITTGTGGTASKVPTEIGSGIIHDVGNNNVTLGTANRPGSNYEPFVKDSLRAQSAGAGMSFEAFANNYTDASFASARSGSLEERLGYQGQQSFLAEKELSRVVAWFIEAAYLSGLAPTAMPGYRIEPHKYHEMFAPVFPGWNWVDPRNEAIASRMLREEGLETRTSLAAQRGKRFADNVEKQIEEEQLLGELYRLRAENQQLMSQAHAPNNQTAN